MKFLSFKFGSFDRLFNKVARSTNLFVVKNFSTNSELVEPVKLSYATYENTSAKDSKDNSPLIILHGLFGSKSNWNSLCKVYQTKMNPQRKIIAVDARNHGDSPHVNEHTYAHMAADIKLLIDQLNFSKVILMGHSMGGRTIMYFALKYPELVDHLIIADISPVTTSPNLHKTIDVFKALETVKLPSNVPMSRARSDVDSQLSSIVTEKPLRSFLLTNLVQRNSGSYEWRINIPVLLTNFNHLARFPSVEELQYKGPVLFVGGAQSDYIHLRWKFNVKAFIENFDELVSFPLVYDSTFDGPTLFIGGGESDFLNKSDLPGIQKMFPKAQMKFIPGAGHLVHSDKPQEFLNITLDFFNEK